MSKKNPNLKGNPFNVRVDGLELDEVKRMMRTKRMTMDAIVKAAIRQYSNEV